MAVWRSRRASLVTSGSFQGTEISMHRPSSRIVTSVFLSGNATAAAAERSALEANGSPMTPCQLMEPANAERCLQTRTGLAASDGRSRATPHRTIGWHRGGTHLVAMLCAACIVVFASEAGAQCSARAGLQNRLMLKTTPALNMPQVPVVSAAAVPVWKTITVGTFADLQALRYALDAVGCGIGNLAEEILARPAFTVSTTETDVRLLAVSVAELGFQGDTASLADIYARARQLGFGLAAAEVAPQLRLQYFDQPIGEFLVIGMEPIKTWAGEPVILNVANGGAGLILISQDGSADAQVSVASRFLFVRSNEAAPADGFDEAAELVDHRISRTERRD